MNVEIIDIHFIIGTFVGLTIAFIMQSIWTLKVMYSKKKGLKEELGKLSHSTGYFVSDGPTTEEPED